VADVTEPADEQVEDPSAQRLGTGHAGVPPVVRMANDIARQFGHLPEDEAAAAVANHVRQFWDPRMRHQLADEVARDPDQLDPIVLTAERTAS
jgi:formate dehydrogenase subunit delta